MDVSPRVSVLYVPVEVEALRCADPLGNGVLSNVEVIHNFRSYSEFKGLVRKSL
jgi:hypothetical protein